MIAGWASTTFKAIGIDAPPGSFRAAVSSNAWENNLPLDDLLSRGNWKRSDTFFKFYCKEICRPDYPKLSTSRNILSDCFRPL